MSRPESVAIQHRPSPHPATAWVHALDTVAEEAPSSVLFHLESPLGYGKLPEAQVSAAGLLSFVQSIGHVLGEHGFRRFDRVGVYKRNEGDYVFLSLGIIRAGGVAVPVNGGMARGHLRAHLEHTGCKVLILDRETFDRELGSFDALPEVETWLFCEPASRTPAGGVSLDDAMRATPPASAPVLLDPDDDVLIVHTSGTTGVPKGVLVRAAGLSHALRLRGVVGPLAKQSRMALVLPYNHLFSHVVMMATVVGRMETWVSTARDRPRDCLALVQQARPRIFVGFPDVYLRMYQTGLDGFDLSSVGLWVGTADAIHDVHKRAFCARGTLLQIGGRPIVRSIFMEALGSSEVGSAAVVHLRTASSRARRDRLVGRCSRLGVRCRIADERGVTLPRGQVGRVMVKGASLFKGYWNAHDRLHGVWFDGWWWTGDLGYRDWRGRFFHLDRAADVIETRDGPVYSLLTEETVMEHPSVAEAAVIGVPGEDGFEVPIVVVAPVAGSTLDPEACRDWINREAQLAAEVQRVVSVPLEDIPRGLTGKVLKRALRERYGPQSTAAEPEQQPRVLPLRAGAC